MRSTTAAVALAAILAPALALPLDSDRVLGSSVGNTITSNLTPGADSGLVDAKIATGLCRALNGVTTMLKLNQTIPCDRIPRVARIVSITGCGSGNGGGSGGNGGNGGSSGAGTSTSTSTTIRFASSSSRSGSSGSGSASSNSGTSGSSGSVDPNNGSNNGDNSDDDDATYDGSSSPILLVSGSNSVGPTATQTGAASASTDTSSSSGLDFNMLLKIFLNSNFDLDGLDESGVKKLVSSVLAVLRKNGSLGLMGALQSATSVTSTATAAVSSSTDLVRGTADVIPFINALLQSADSNGSNSGDDTDDELTSALDPSHDLALGAESNSLLAAALPLHLGAGNALSDTAASVGLNGATDPLSPTLSSVTGASNLLRLVVHGASGTASGALSKATDALTGAPLLHAGVNGVTRTVTGALSQATDGLTGGGVDGASAAAAFDAVLHASTGSVTGGSLPGSNDVTGGVLHGASLGSSSKLSKLTGNALLIHAAVHGATSTVSQVLSKATGAVGSKSDVGRPLIHGVLRGATGTAAGALSKATGGVVPSASRQVKSTVGHATHIAAHASAATGVVDGLKSLTNLGGSDDDAHPIHAGVGQGSRVAQGSGAHVDT